MSNTIGPKVGSTVPAAKPAEAQRTTGATAPQAPATTGPAGWQPVAGRQPSAAAQAIAPGSGKSEVICPVLRALANEGRVQLAADGTVNLDELNKAIKELGGSKPLGVATWGIGAIGNKPSDILSNLTHRHFSLTELPQGIVPHPADSQILRSGTFNEQRFNELVAHAENGVMTSDSFAKAIAANYQRDRAAGAGFIDSAVRGLNFAQLEFAGLLSVFGSKDNATGKNGIKVSDLREMYEHGRIPPGMQGQASGVVEAMAIQASLKVKTDVNLARSAFDSVFTPTGLASAGARLSGGGPAGAEATAAQQAAMGAGKTACPHMGGKMKPPPPSQVLKSHL